MEICNIHMTKALPAQSSAVFIYAVKHGYQQLGDLAAPKTISRPFDELMNYLQDDSDILFAWIQYREWWLKIFLSAFDSPTLLQSNYHQCSSCRKFYHVVLAVIASDMGTMEDLGAVIATHASPCGYCSPSNMAWSSTLSSKVTAVPKFSSVFSSQYDVTSSSSYPARVLSNLVSFVMGYTTGLVSPVRPLTELPASPECPVQGCPLEIDVVLESSDGTRFGSHVKNLETYSDGFPPSEFSNSNIGTPVPEVVLLPESSDVLSLLLHYMHNQRQPQSSVFKFNILSQLAEAAEKYMVFSAIEVCRIHMKEAIADHPLPVLRYAAIHSYPELSDSAAPRTISLSLVEAEKSLHDTPKIFLAWLRYRECWLTVLRSTLDRSMVTVSHGHGRCQGWLNIYHSLLARIGLDLGKMRDVDRFFELQESWQSYCGPCNEAARTWRVTVHQRIAGIPKFSSFL